MEITRIEKMLNNEKSLNQYNEIIEIDFAFSNVSRNISILLCIKVTINLYKNESGFEAL